MIGKNIFLMSISFWISFSSQAACPSWPTAERFNISGAEVLDNRTGLIWARCAEGQTWNGTTCAGTASKLVDWQVFPLAQAKTGWRIPNVKELATLVDRGCFYPAIDPIAFPSTPNIKFWSSTPQVVSDAKSGYAVWLVDFSFGGVDGKNGIENDFSVRLVRTSQ